MKQISTFFLLLVLMTSCQQQDLQGIAKEALAEELIEVEADSGLVILMKDNEVVAQVNLVADNDSYRLGDESAFQEKRDMGTLLSTACMMAVLDCVSPTDTVDVGDGVYIKEGQRIEDHNADMGGYGVLTVKQVIAFDSRVGITKLMERCPQGQENLRRMGFSPLPASPMEVTSFYNRIANKDRSLCADEAMSEIRSMLSKVVTDGTGKNLFSDSLAIAGKTGSTANKEEVSCCGFFTINGSIYTCLVIVSHPKNGYPSGGVMAGNVVKEVANCLMKK
ncbi:MAG: penicillin-binding transpeptidase domain-containing protein [Parabacteroides sp.]|nr:penicillin-binding transpeptidase domain-containing protein [bacterium]MDY4103087.1 penicillin-binding transpeptidase domain-containing protein [Parabacteroides sp.]